MCGSGIDERRQHGGVAVVFSQAAEDLSVLLLYSYPRGLEVTDITEIAADEGKLHLSVVIDLFQQAGERR